MEAKDFSPGDLVEILCDRTHTSDQLMTANTCDNGGIFLYEQINLRDYPGYNDFEGYKVEALPESVATVIQYVGRPMRIVRGYRENEYDVYEVITPSGATVMVFANNMKRLDITAPKSPK